MIAMVETLYRGSVAAIIHHNVVAVFSLARRLKQITKIPVHDFRSVAWLLLMKFMCNSCTNHNDRFSAAAFD